MDNLERQSLFAEGMRVAMKMKLAVNNGTGLLLEPDEIKVFTKMCELDVNEIVKPFNSDDWSAFEDFDGEARAEQMHLPRLEPVRDWKPTERVYAFIREVYFQDFEEKFNELQKNLDEFMPAGILQHFDGYFIMLYSHLVEVQPDGKIKIEQEKTENDSDN